MFGYVRPVRMELKIREWLEFRKFYCGVCVAVRKHGFLARFFLSYDSVFFAILLAALNSGRKGLNEERHFCWLTLKPVRIFTGESVENSASAFALLLKYKLLDDAVDGRSLIKRFLSGLIHSKGLKMWEEMKIVVVRHLETLKEVELRKSSDLDEAATVFGNLTAAIFKSVASDENQALVMEHLGRHLGMWIYLLDAYNDLEEDLKKGSYNPVLEFYKSRFLMEWENSRTLDPEDIKQRTLNVIREKLYGYLDQVWKAYDLLVLKDFKSILDNIVYFGLQERTEMVLSGSKRACHLKRL
ncbi:DUF5685 family protein [Fervidobacterium thailandense]|uniref:Uncharacterized protein n=1 Tax=Fervidobacterium thailandense TaxID=1008305 RepID=A0A1E3G2I4_9BACT|nr:DUF5685 family protein [Fervidobacterium thailandense]ODN30494.1 hypothetical protein A4H02_05560 [Fervidobacterium thailandense]